jgi:hypothetical protein
LIVVDADVIVNDFLVGAVLSARCGLGAATVSLRELRTPNSVSSIATAHANAITFDGFMKNSSYKIVYGGNAAFSADN